MYTDTVERIRVCQECQVHAHVSRELQHPMIPITSPWPLCKWAIDIVGPFPKGAGFSIPNEIFSDNGKQFEGNPFRSWCQDLNIKQRFTSVAHPQANGQYEVTNRDIVHTIKARLGMKRIGWVDELPKVL
ncbi:uncharacterized protein [Rutidosis leptorrhynchoides]|uniref:uncharacterized protein n=1 Tax=Rutidosis leptorrhynchoides TaxID=125765 RepID=UPI003A98FA1B